MLNDMCNFVPSDMKIVLESTYEFHMRYLRPTGVHFVSAFVSCDMKIMFRIV
jgi:hypothetical protein